MRASVGPYSFSRLPRTVNKTTSTRKLNLDDMIDENGEASRSHAIFAISLLMGSQAKSEEEGSDNGSQPEEEDYDVDEEFDNDYAENYFDNGEGDDMDDLGDGGGGGGDMGNGFHVSRTFMTVDPNVCFAGEYE